MGHPIRSWLRSGRRKSGATMGGSPKEESPMSATTAPAPTKPEALPPRAARSRRARPDALLADRRRSSRARWRCSPRARGRRWTTACRRGVTIALNAIAIFVMFTVLHDASHYSISSTRWVNWLFGRVAMLFVSPLIVVPGVRVHPHRAPPPHQRRRARPRPLRQPRPVVAAARSGSPRWTCRTSASTCATCGAGRGPR